MPQHPLFADDMQEIVESFVVETRELFERLDDDLLRLEQSPGDQALIDDIFRAVHTVKGTAGFLSLEQLALLAHHVEDVLNRLRRGSIGFVPGMVDTLLAALDAMKRLLQQVERRELAPLNLDALTESLAAMTRGGDATPQSSPAPAAEAPEQSDAIPAEVEEAPAPSDTPIPREAVARPNSDTHRTETIRVEVQRLDSLMNLVGELVLGRNRLLQVTDGLNGGNAGEAGHALSEVAQQIDAITKELQAAVMGTRMLPIGRVFNRFPRVIRDLAHEFGKQINVVLEGEDTELDKSVIEEIGDPLVHLIRNAADHGIELPAAREAAGKPPAGTIRMSAAQEGNQIVIRIEDDGAGMDPGRLKEAALAKQLISFQEAAEMTDSEAYALIFRPGFSTARQVSRVSGRGVGMDVVMTNISRLNGTISIDSEPGRGTRFVLRLPLTLAIIQSLLVRAGQETYALPLHVVAEIVRLHEADIASIRGHEVVRLRDEAVPLIRVDAALGHGGGHHDGKVHNGRLYAVITTVGPQRVGLVVDGLLGQKEIVIKPLGNYFGKVPCVSGLTTIGDGQVVTILDVAELIQAESARLRTRAWGSDVSTASA